MGITVAAMLESNRLIYKELAYSLETNPRV